MSQNDLFFCVFATLSLQYDYINHGLALCRTGEVPTVRLPSWITVGACGRAEL